METVINQKQKLVLWKTAIALQAVDGLEVSSNFMKIAKQNIKGTLSAEKVAIKAKKHDDENGTNLVAARMFAIFSDQDEFNLSQEELSSIHNELFDDIIEAPGELRQKNIAKKEWALDGKALLYPDAKDVPNLLNEIFAKESEFNFDGKDSDSIAKHVAEFISQLWQIHPFEKFNTRAIATFLVKYIMHLGYAFDNDALARNPVFFRNALARAAYSEPEEGIEADTKYLELLMQNILCGAKHSLNHKAIHLNYVDEEGVAVKDKNIVAEPKKKRAKKSDSQKKSAAKKFSEKKPSERKTVAKKPRSKKPKVMETGVRIKLPEEIEAEKLAAEKKETAKKSAPKKTAAPKKPRAKKVAEIDEDKKEKILAYLRENKSITNSQAREIIDSSTETARKALVKLAEEGIVTAQGANRNRVYILN